jgi:hypothetical protein
MTHATGNNIGVGIANKVNNNVRFCSRPRAIFDWLSLVLPDSMCGAVFLLIGRTEEALPSPSGGTPHFDKSPATWAAPGRGFNMLAVLKAKRPEYEALAF